MIMGGFGRYHSQKPPMIMELGVMRPGNTEERSPGVGDRS